MGGADDIGRWSERVAGRGDALDPQSVDADLLRAAARAEDARAAHEGAADRVGLERLTRRLEREGLLEPAPAASSPSDPTRPSATPSTATLPRWLAIAASVAVVAIGARFLWPFAPDDPSQVRPVEPPATLPVPPAERPRGFAGVVKQAVPDPAAQATQAGDELAALGLAPRRIEADARVILEVEVGALQLDAYRGYVEARGGRADAPGLYRLVFEPAP